MRKTATLFDRDWTGDRSRVVWLTGQDINGPMFHYPNSRMAKMELRNFSLKRQAGKMQGNR